MEFTISRFIKKQEKKTKQFPTNPTQLNQHQPFLLLFKVEMISLLHF